MREKQIRRKRGIIEENEMIREMEESFRAERERERRKRNGNGNGKRREVEEELYMLSAILHLAFLQRQLFYSLPLTMKRKRERER